MRQSLMEALEHREYMIFTELELTVAEAVLWDTNRNAKWLANLAAVRKLWQES